MDGAETGERFLQLVVDDVVLLDVEPGEEGLIEEPALSVAAAAVEVMGVGEQSEAGFDEPGVGGEVIGGVLQALGELLAFLFDAAELLADLRLREAAVGGEVQQVGFLDIEAMQLVGQLLLQKPLGGALVVEGLADVSADVGNELLAEAQRGVVVFDGAFDELDVGVAAGAAAVAVVDAEEVLVHVAARVLRVLDVQPLNPSCPVTGAAVDGPLEVVMMNAAPFPRDSAGLDEGLDFTEEVLVDKRLVAPLIPLAGVGDAADVVLVTGTVRETVGGLARHAGVAR